MSYQGHMSGTGHFVGENDKFDYLPKIRFNEATAPR